VIHDKAGPKLRVECKKVIGPKGTLPTGEARITGAYQLPSKYVLHTVGPIIDNPQEGLKPEELAACYTNCLELAKQHKLKSVAFCCISTGVFGYPQEPAAEVALASVRDWLSKPENSEALDLVVFNVFTEKDLDIYSKLAPTVFK
jgi:O-acetyl-ADP-ribose deacetylase (regulator of RNase III)